MGKLSICIIFDKSCFIQAVSFGCGPCSLQGPTVYINCSVKDVSVKRFLKAIIRCAFLMFDDALAARLKEPEKDFTMFSASH